MKGLPTLTVLLAVAAYQSLAQAQEANLAAPIGEREQLFALTCGRCHRAGGMGTGILSRRPGLPDGGLLEKRTDLSALLIQTAVRRGIGNMPRISRGEVSDPQLALITDYLTRGKR